MKKTILFLLTITLFISSCEKDDFCLENPVTPNLILRFYDDVNRETLKKPASLYVWAEGKDSIFTDVTLDSIYLPLNSAATKTVYNFSDGTDVEQFTISYTTEEEYVSRSCGYKIIFNDVTFTSTGTWFKDFSPETLTTIDNQDAAHVQIFH